VGRFRVLIHPKIKSFPREKYRPLLKRRRRRKRRKSGFTSSLNMEKSNMKLISNTIL